MKVLVGYASKYGATDAIAHQVGSVLAELGINVTVARLAEAKAEGYDAYVIGSAIYAGNWLRDARRFITKYHDELTRKRVWLFSSGPVGRPLKPEGEPPGVEDYVFELRPEEHVVFAGKLQKARLNFLEKAMVSVIQAPEGDFRDWEAVRHWALEVGNKLGAGVGAR